MLTEKDAEYIFKEIALNKKTYKQLAPKYGLHYTTLCKNMKKFKSYFGMQENEIYSAKTFLRYKHKQEIINAYNNGENTKNIALKYGLSDDHMIAQLLREFNVKIRSVGYQSKTDQSLFKSINSEIAAYSLGLITSDGSVSENYSITITLHENDKYLLEEINKRMCNNTGYIGQTKGRTTARLVFNGKQICQNLKQYNVVPNKSHVMTSIYTFENPKIMQHYIRGLFDGDGVCALNGNYLRLGYCAHIKDFTESYQNFLCNLLHLKKNKMFNTGGSWNCSWGSKQDVEKIYKYLYKDASIFLKRKKEKIENYLYGDTEVTK